MEPREVSDAVRHRPYVTSHSKLYMPPESRGLLRRLGLSFFLFGLINNGTPKFQLHHCHLIHSSALCHHPLRRSRPRPAIHAEGHHRLLQHLPLHARQARLAIPPPRPRTVRETTRRLRSHQYPRHVGKSDALNPNGRCVG